MLQNTTEYGKSIQVHIHCLIYLSQDASRTTRNATT